MTVATLQLQWGLGGPESDPGVGMGLVLRAARPTTAEQLPSAGCYLLYRCCLRHS